MHGNLAFNSVVIDDLDVPHAVLGPDEADAKLVVDANAVLALAVSRQRFQPVARRVRNASSVAALSSCWSLRSATAAKLAKRFTRLPANRSAVSLSAKETITASGYTGYR